MAVESVIRIRISPLFFENLEAKRLFHFFNSSFAPFSNFFLRLFFSVIEVK